MDNDQMELLKILGLAALIVLVWYMAFWLLCLLNARRCPYCGSKWQTELMGEWGEEDWKCHRCNSYFQHPYKNG